MNEPTFRRDLIAELKGIRAALEAANELNPLNVIPEILERENAAQAGAEGAVRDDDEWVGDPRDPEHDQRIYTRAEFERMFGPTESFPGVLAIYRHPAGEGWRIVARRRAGVPGGWAVEVEGSG